MITTTPIQRECGIGLKIAGVENVIWGLPEEEAMCEALFKAGITNLPKGAIGYKKKFSRKTLATCVVEFETYFKEYHLNIDQTNVEKHELGLLLAITGK
jgi:hypothetical protein